MFKIILHFANSLSLSIPHPSIIFILKLFSFKKLIIFNRLSVIHPPFNIPKSYSIFVFFLILLIFYIHLYYKYIVNNFYYQYLFDFHLKFLNCFYYNHNILNQDMFLIFVIHYLI